MLHPAMLYEPLENERVHCFLCAHHCRIAPGRYGFCGVRQNQQGSLVTHAYGYTVAAGTDPIEKKPLFHVLPGSRSYSIAAIGCNFRCAFCQNWQISQRAEAEALGIGGTATAPETIVRRALEAGCRSIAYTYTEPTIFFEYAFDTARRARENGLLNIFVTNGYMTKEALDAVRPYLDAANVDLKFFDDRHYREVCKATLSPVLDTIRRMHEYGIWVEVTTLVIPGQNDSPGELTAIAEFIAGTGAEIPWHISVFHPDYRFTDVDATPLATLQRAWEIGKKAGLRYVYKGNIAEEEATRCYNCGEIVIRRCVFEVRENRLVDTDHCPRCRAIIDGIFK